MSLLACEPCLRRCILLGRIAELIECAVADQPGRRAAELLSLPDEDLVAALAPTRREEVLARAAAVPVSGLTDALQATGAWSLCIHSNAYPAGLHDCGDAPRLLTGIGAIELLERLEPQRCVAVVGARRASTYGRSTAGRLGGELASAGMTVVSGMALGVDSAAHLGAVDAGGLTVAVLGSGVDVAYPRSHQRLYRRITESGLVISELPPGTRPYRWTFPARNRIIAGLASITVVVEAAEHSGSLITAGFAADLGRDVGAVPGPVTASLSRGANRLLADGAVLVRDAQDVLDLLLGPGMRPDPAPGPQLDRELLEVLLLVEEGFASADGVARAGELDAARAGAALTRLELLGYLQRDLGGRYARTSQLAPSGPGVPP